MVLDSIAPWRERLFDQSTEIESSRFGIQFHPSNTRGTGPCAHNCAIQPWPRLRPVPPSQTRQKPSRIGSAPSVTRRSHPLRLADTSTFTSGKRTPSPQMGCMTWTPSGNSDSTSPVGSPKVRCPGGELRHRRGLRPPSRGGAPLPEMPKLSPQGLHCPREKTLRRRWPRL